MSHVVEDVDQMVKSVYSNDSCRYKCKNLLGGVYVEEVNIASWRM